MLMSQVIADARQSPGGMAMFELRHDLAIGRAAETAPDTYKATITPQVIALWAYRHVKRIRFPPHGGTSEYGRSTGFAHELQMKLDVMHPSESPPALRHRVYIVATCKVGGRVFARQAEIADSVFPRHFQAVVQTARQLMQALVQGALMDSYDIAAENDDSDVGLHQVDNADLSFFPGPERKSIRDARTMERFGWYSSNVLPADPRRTLILNDGTDTDRPYGVAGVEAARRDQLIREMMREPARKAVWGAQPQRIEVGLDLSQPQRLGEFRLHEGDRPLSDDDELGALARKLNVSRDLLKKLARIAAKTDASLKSMARAAEQMRPHLIHLGKAIATALDNVEMPHMGDALDQIASAERQMRFTPDDYARFTCGPGCSGAPDCACPTCVAKDSELVDKLQHKLAADTARRIIGTDGPKLLVRPRDVARFEGWGDYAARHMLTRPADITDELWQHALEILAGERPDFVR